MNDTTSPEQVAESVDTGITSATATIDETPPFSEKQVNWLANTIRSAFRETMAEWKPPGIMGPPSGGGGSPPLSGSGSPPLGDGPPLGTAPLNPNRPDTPNNDYIMGAKGVVTYGVLSGSTYTYVNFPVEQVTFDDDLETDDITNTSSGGGKIMLDNLQQITGTITFVWDSLNIFLVAPLPFKPRTYVKLQIMPDGISIIAFTALVNGHSSGTGPKFGTVRVACKYMSSGPITYPTANQTTPTPALTS